MSNTIWDNINVNELLQIIKPHVYEFQTKKDHKFFVELFDHYIMYAASMDSSSHPDDVAIDKKLMKSAYRIMKTMLVCDNLHCLMELHKMIKRFGVEIGVQIFMEDHQ